MRTYFDALNLNNVLLPKESLKKQQVSAGHSLQ